MPHSKILSLFFLPAVDEDGINSLGIEDKLLAKLRSQARGKGRPVKRSGDNITISLGLSLAKILEMVCANKLITIPDC